MHLKLVLIFSILSSTWNPLLSTPLCEDFVGIEEKAATQLGEIYKLEGVEKLYEGQQEKPLLRFAHWLHTVHKHITEVNPTELIDSLIAKDTRFNLFMIEEMSRSYSSFEKKFRKVFTTTRSLENAIGQYAFALEVTKSAKKIGIDSVDINALSAREVSARENLEKVMAEEGWLPKANGKIPAIEKILSVITRKKNLLEARKERKELLRYFGKSIKRILETDFDMNLLEDGIHEYRRELRKLQIMIYAKRGLARISPDRGLVRDRALIDSVSSPEIAGSKYVPEFPAFIDTAPVVISRPYVLALLKAIRDFGRIKDIGEKKEAIISQWLERELFSSHQAAETHYNKKIIELGLEPIDPHVEAKRLYKEFNDFRVLEGLYNEVRVAY